MKRTALRAGFLVLLLALASGCGRYATLRLPAPTEGVTIQSLQENWRDYDVYYAGVHAGHPSAVMFDRKDDDGVIVTNRWFKPRDKALLDDIIDSIQRQVPVGGYRPRLWRITGPDGHVYGYMFTSWNHAAMSMVGEKKLLVRDLPMPPYLAIDGAGFDLRDH